MGLSTGFRSAGRAVQISRRDNLAQLLPIALYQHARIALHLGKLRKPSPASGRPIQASEKIRAHLVPDDLLKQGYTTRRQSLFALWRHAYVTSQHGDPAEALEPRNAPAPRLRDLLATRELEALRPPLPAACNCPSAAVLTRRLPLRWSCAMRETAARLGATLVVYWPTTRPPAHLGGEAGWRVGDSSGTRYRASSVNWLADISRPVPLAAKRRP